MHSLRLNDIDEISNGKREDCKIFKTTKFILIYVATYTIQYDTEYTKQTTFKSF